MGSCVTDNTELQRRQATFYQASAYIICLRKKYVYLSNYVLLRLIFFLIPMPMKKLFCITWIVGENSLSFKIFKIKLMKLVNYKPETQASPKPQLEPSLPRLFTRLPSTACFCLPPFQPCSQKGAPRLQKEVMLASHRGPDSPTVEVPELGEGSLPSLPLTPQGLHTLHPRASECVNLLKEKAQTASADGNFWACPLPTQQCIQVSSPRMPHLIGSDPHCVRLLFYQLKVFK